MTRPSGQTAKITFYDKCSNFVSHYFDVFAYSLKQVRINDVSLPAHSQSSHPFEFIASSPEQPSNSLVQE